MKNAILTTLVLVSAATAVSAKGLTTRISLRDATLQTSIDITDRSVLRAFNVWAGPGTYANGVEGKTGFIIDWPAGIARDRPRDLAKYEVTFYVQYRGRSAEDWCTVVFTTSINPRHDPDSDRFVPDVAIADIATVVNKLGGRTSRGAGTPTAPFTRLQQVFVRQHGDWSIASYHNVDVKGPCHHASWLCSRTRVTHVGLRLSAIKRVDLQGRADTLTRLLIAFR